MAYTNFPPKSRVWNISKLFNMDNYLFMDLSLHRMVFISLQSYIDKQNVAEEILWLRFRIDSACQMTRCDVSGTFETVMFTVYMMCIVLKKCERLSHCSSGIRYRGDGRVREYPKWSRPCTPSHEIYKHRMTWQFTRVSTVHHVWNEIASRIYNCWFHHFQHYILQFHITIETHNGSLIEKWTYPQFQLNFKHPILREPKWFPISHGFA